MVQNGGQNQKGPTNGRIGYMIPAVSGVSNASQPGTKLAVAHKWKDWLHNPCHLRGPQRFREADKIQTGPQGGGLATKPLLFGGSPTLESTGQNQQWPANGRIGYITPAVWGAPQRFKAGDKIRSGPQVDGLATLPLPCGGSPNASERGTKSAWPTNGRIGCITPAIWEVPNASELGTKSFVAHKWAD